MATLLGDMFSDVDGTTLASHTMNAGSGWTASVGTIKVSAPVSAAVGVAIPNSNADGDHAVADAGAADVVVSCQVTPTHGGGWENDPDLILRWSDSTHWWSVHVTSGGGAVQLYENAGSGAVQRATTSFAFASGTAYLVTVVCKGPLIAVYINGVKKIGYGSATSNQTATKFGLRVGVIGSVGTKCTWDDFSVLSVPTTFRPAADRVMETSTTTGTGTLTLAGAVTGYQSFGAVGNAQQCYAAVWGVDASGVPTGEWEVTGPETYTVSGTTLTRSGTVLSSSTGARVSFSSGTKRVALVRTAMELTAPYVHAYNSADLTIPDRTQQYLTFNSNYEDSAGFHSTAVNTSRLVVPPDMGGIYVVSALARWSINGQGGRQMVLQVNRFNVLAVQSVVPVPDPFTETDQFITSPPVRLSAGDFVECYVNQSSGATLAIKFGGRFSPNLGMCRLTA